MTDAYLTGFVDTCVAAGITKTAGIREAVAYGIAGDALDLAEIADEIGDNEQRSQLRERPRRSMKSLVKATKERLQLGRKIDVAAADPEAAAYIKANKDKIRKLLNRLNVQGDI